jgi:tetratricopeptide (TPR) repeat protein
MGFYFASPEISTLGGEYAPTITAREYVSGLTNAQGALIGVWGARCRRCRLAACLIANGRPERAIEALRAIVRRTPSHDHAHCLLGLAHLVRGDEQRAIRHLEIAFDVAQRKLTSASVLGEALRRQSEAALLRLLLLRLRVRLGRLDAARALLEDGHGVR